MKLRFQQIQGDLFSAPPTTSLAHCVSTDMNMSKGIATQFGKKFGHIDDLKRQNIQVGGCAYLRHENRHVFYLVTKRRYFHKPTLITLEASLISMRDLCIENDIHQLAMPRIGCGLDKLEWSEVTELIQRVFGQVDIEITIYSRDDHTVVATSRKRRGIDHQDRDETERGSEPNMNKSRRDRDQSFVGCKKKT